MTDTGHGPKNALQQLISEYLADNPGESYASIGRRGSTSTHPFPRSTVHSLATKPQLRQTPQTTTVEALARGMNMSEEVVRAAAANAAGYDANVSSDVESWQARFIVEAVKHLDTERLDSLARRARYLLAEMEEEKRLGTRGLPASAEET